MEPDIKEDSEVRNESGLAGDMGSIDTIWLYLGYINPRLDKSISSYDDFRCTGFFVVVKEGTDSHKDGME